MSNAIGFLPDMDPFPGPILPRFTAFIVNCFPSISMSEPIGVS